DLCPGRYNGPQIAAKFLEQYYPENERPNVRLIDIAAGTGRVGRELLDLGFHKIDALEPSDGMLQIAKQQQLYQEYYLESIGTTKTSISDDVYDCLVISGGMGEGHIPTKALNEMIRIVKPVVFFLPGGLICIVMREEYLTVVSEYAGKLENYMHDLQEQQLWEQISRTIIPNYSFQKNGVVFMYKVLPTN
uniref:Methyltransferase domain-containing protein n=1 Tax=Strigamia maritima TaxID=126957 RepID=T1JM27_STRMM